VNPRGRSSGETAAGGPPRQALADVSRFFEVSRRLSESGVISGPDYTGEIAGYLCSSLLGVRMVPFRDRSGFDGMLDGRRVAVRFTNCPHGRPLAVPEPDSWEILLAVLGPRCTLKPVAGWSILVYEFRAEDLPRIATAGARGLVLDATAFARSEPALDVALPTPGGREGVP